MQSLLRPGLEVTAVTSWHTRPHLYVGHLQPALALPRSWRKRKSISRDPLDLCSEGTLVSALEHHLLAYLRKQESIRGRRHELRTKFTFFDALLRRVRPQVEVALLEVRTLGFVGAVVAVDPAIAVLDFREAAAAVGAGELAQTTS